MHILARFLLNVSALQVLICDCRQCRPLSASRLRAAASCTRTATFVSPSGPPSFRKVDAAANAAAEPKPAALSTALEAPQAQEHVPAPQEQQGTQKECSRYLRPKPCNEFDNDGKGGLRNLCRRCNRHNRVNIGSMRLPQCNWLQHLLYTRGGRNMAQCKR